MKTVLILTYYWPPAGGPGSQRVVKFVKYLPEFGWNPIVVTPAHGEFPYLDASLEAEIPSGIRVVRTKNWEPFLYFKKFAGKGEAERLPVGYITREKRSWKERLATWIRVNLFVPDARVGWVPFAISAALGTLHDSPVQVIFSSSPPHSLQLAALRLHRKTGLPWVADLRDPWTDIRYYKFVKRNWLARTLDAYLERRVLETASRVTCITEAARSLFASKIYSPAADKFVVLPNGYDEADFHPDSLPSREKFIILHAGNLLAHQNPRALWQALQQLRENFPDRFKSIEVRLFGQVDEKIVQAVHQAGLSDVVKFLDFIPHGQIVREMEQAGLLFLVVPEVADSEGIVPGKLFEYIGSGRPILVIAPKGADARRLVEPFPNSLACGFDEGEKVFPFLKNLLDAWKEGKLPLLPPEYRQPYSRRHLTRRLAELFDALTASGH